jgi:hypothetical protein
MLIHYNYEVINVSTINRTLVSQPIVPRKWTEGKQVGLSGVPMGDTSNV